MNDENARLVIKQASGVPTIPVSLDPRNGDWLETDIFEGEFYQDLDSGKMYNRNSVGITDANGELPTTLYKAKISQTGVLAPTEDNFFQNDLAGTWNYSAVGIYTLDTIGFFTDIDKVFLLIQNNNATPYFFNYTVGTNSLTLNVRNAAGVLTNGAITGASIEIQEYL
jgi:hypothetical protein